MSSDNLSKSATPVLSAAPRSARSRGPLIIGGLVVTLLVLHQDNWFWTDGTLVLGFMPIGLSWHVLISIGAFLTWGLATKIAWPIDHDTFPDGDAANSQPGGAKE